MNNYRTEPSLKSVLVVGRHGDRYPLEPLKQFEFDNDIWCKTPASLTKFGVTSLELFGNTLSARYPALMKNAHLNILHSAPKRCLDSALAVGRGIGLNPHQIMQVEDDSAYKNMQNNLQLEYPVRTETAKKMEHANEIIHGTNSIPSIDDVQPTVKAHDLLFLDSVLTYVNANRPMPTSIVENKLFLENVLNEALFDAWIAVEKPIAQALPVFESVVKIVENFDRIIENSVFLLYTSDSQLWRLLGVFSQTDFRKRPNAGACIILEMYTDNTAQLRYVQKPDAAFEKINGWNDRFPLNDFRFAVQKLIK